LVLAGLGIVGGGTVWYKGYLKGGNNENKVEPVNQTGNGVEEEPKEERFI
jgi:hypothetical protein